MWFGIAVFVMAVLLVLGHIHFGDSGSGWTEEDEKRWENQPRTTGNGW